MKAKCQQNRNSRHRWRFAPLGCFVAMAGPVILLGCSNGGRGTSVGDEASVTVDRGDVIVERSSVQAATAEVMRETIDAGYRLALWSMRYYGQHGRWPESVEAMFPQDATKEDRIVRDKVDDLEFVDEPENRVRLHFVMRSLEAQQPIRCSVRVRLSPGDEDTLQSAVDRVMREEFPE